MRRWTFLWIIQRCITFLSLFLSLFGVRLHCARQSRVRARVILFKTKSRARDLLSSLIIQFIEMIEYDRCCFIYFVHGCFNISWCFNIIIIIIIVHISVCVVVLKIVHSGKDVHKDFIASIPNVLWTETSSLNCVVWCGLFWMWIAE